MTLSIFLLLSFIGTKQPTDPFPGQDIVDGNALCSLKSRRALSSSGANSRTRIFNLRRDVRYQFNLKSSDIVHKDVQ